MTHADRILSALAERMSGFPLISSQPRRCECGEHAPTQCPEAPWADPRVQDVLNRAAHKADARRFTGEAPSAFGELA